MPPVTTVFVIQDPTDFRTHTEERPPQAALRPLDRPPACSVPPLILDRRCRRTSRPRNIWARTPFERRVGRVILSLWRTPTSCGSAPKPSDRWYKAPSRRRCRKSRPTAERTDFFRSRPLLGTAAVTTSLQPGAASGYKLTPAGVTTSNLEPRSRESRTKFYGHAPANDSARARSPTPPLAHGTLRAR